MVRDCRAEAAAWVRLSTPSLARIASTWWPTVLGLMDSLVAMSRVDERFGQRAQRAAMQHLEPVAVDSVQRRAPGQLMAEPDYIPLTDQHPGIQAFGQAHTRRGAHLPHQGRVATPA
jgi:hypothetical protein